MKNLKNYQKEIIKNLSKVDSAQRASVIKKIIASSFNEEEIKNYDFLSSSTLDLCKGTRSLKKKRMKFDDFIDLSGETFFEMGAL